ncbi:AI-2E family transporter [Roseiterribacter gracilis]|uniref:AI-2E family transporter n=1 Tax=Roseiterribacter gracilis TaxID=2812848 RepID=A0A8S8XDI1_9PROT|nr:AI-2E family transporter [Rhodospirillales bacterium TMPK1]
MTTHGMGRHAWFWLIVGAVLVFLLYELREVLLPFALGAAIAFLFDPIADRLERLRVPRWAATVIVLIGVFALMIGFVLLIVPLVQAQLWQLIGRVPAYFDAVRLRLLPQLEELVATYSSTGAEELQKAVGTYAGDAAKWLAGGLGTLVAGGMALVNVLSILLIAPVVSFYLLRDWDLIVQRIDSWLPRRSRGTLRAIFAEMDETLTGFVRGQALVCLFLAVFYSITLSLVRLDFALVIGLFIGVISIMPYVGTISGFVVSVGVALGQYDDRSNVFIVIGIFVLGQILEGNVVQPLFIGDRVRLHPVWIIFALLAGGSLFGFLGVLLAVPVAAVIGVLVRFGIRRYLASPFYEEPVETALITTDVS